MADDVSVLMNKLSEALTPGSAPRFELVKASSVVSVRVNWIWQGRLPCGKFVVVDGMPGVGKTTAMMDLIARASRGDVMPGCHHGAEPIPIIIVGAEDDWADTIRPRLEAAGADLDRIYFVKARSGELFTLPMDTAELKEWVEQTGAKWIHIETIMGVLDGSVNTNSDQEVRRALAPLVDLAGDLDVLVTCVRHPRKNGAAAAVAAGGGSTAFSAIARVVIFVGFDPSAGATVSGPPSRVFAVAKSNLSAKAESLTFELVSTENGHASVVWGEQTPVSADELAAAPMQTPRPPREIADSPGKRTHAELVLWEILAGGAPVPVVEIEARASQQGVPARTLYRAATSLGVQRIRQGYQGASSWLLPDGGMSVSGVHDAPNVPDPQPVPDFQISPSLPSLPSGGSRGKHGKIGKSRREADPAPPATSTRVSEEALDAP